MVLPLVLIVVFLSGLLSFLASREALTRVAMRHMAYKAEQMRDFAISEWDAIAELGLDDEPFIQVAAEESLRSYALSLLRSDTELVFAVDHDGNLAMHVGAESANGETDRLSTSEDLTPGWFAGSVNGEARVGVVFEVEPFGWLIAVTELSAVFFTDARGIFRTQAIVSLIAIASVTLLVWTYIGLLIRLVERLTRTIQGITDTGDLSRRARIEYLDEVGVLAHGFNNMVSLLETNYRKLEQTVEAEALARETAVEREEETIFLLGRVSEFHDKETGEHLERIGRLSALFFGLLGKSTDEQDLIRRGSGLHDIGKIAISDKILLKAAALTDDEYDQMKKHAEIGYELLRASQSRYLVTGAEIALTHHEKWDGTGYPARLSGEQIPLTGRVVGLVDVFDALTSERPYKKAWPAADVRAYIVEQRGRHFDPDLVDLFDEYFERFRAIIAR